ncbi:hypothetical protein AB9M75_07520 [Lactobacillus sp. AN1001]
MDNVNLSQYFNSIGMGARRAGQYYSAIENYTKAISFWPNEIYFYNRAQAQLFIADNPRVSAFLSLDDFLVYLLLSYQNYKLTLDTIDVVEDSYLEFAYEHCRMANKCFNIAWNRFSVNEKTLRLLLRDLIVDDFLGYRSVKIPKEWQKAFDSMDVFFDYTKRLMTIKSEFANYFSSSRDDVKQLLDDHMAREDMLELIEQLTAIYYSS